MKSAHKPHKHHDFQSVGWITYADFMMICVLTVLIGAFLLQEQLYRRQREVVKLNDIISKKEVIDIDAMRKQLKDSRDEIAKLIEDSAIMKQMIDNQLKETSKLNNLNRERLLALEEIRKLQEIIKNKDKQIDLLKNSELRESQLLTENERLIDLLKTQTEAKNKIFKPLEKSQMIIRVRVDSLPDWLDLDLYVQDPKNTVCYWNQPRVLGETSETGILIPSENIFSTQVAEEIFHSNEIISSGEESPYLVFCMLRENGNSSKNIDNARKTFEVKWEIQIRKDLGLIKIGEGSKTIANTGQILVQDGNYLYPNLIALTGFSVTGTYGNYKISIAEKLSELPRGWENTTPRNNARRFEKIRD